MAAGSARDIWAAGYYNQTGRPGGDQPLTLHWDGTAWRIVPSPIGEGENASQLFGLAIPARDNVWAVGVRGTQPSSTLILHWDGQRWHPVPTADGDHATRDCWPSPPCRRANSGR